MYRKGHIFIDCFWVACGICEFAIPTGSDRFDKSERDIREQGWSKTAKHGWICSDCKEKRAEKRDDEST